jgi:hypothetical protein
MGGPMETFTPAVHRTWDAEAPVMGLIPEPVAVPVRGQVGRGVD